ncbi:hypothetical protein [Kineococcus glutinatus]|uniref:Uncharacterized protein n=1 Tax=Kineococcus glutinatus TaxID=1070872 RepID=A0ABP8VAD9_9ACTN
MPLQLGRRTAVLTGALVVEDAEPLATWLRATGEARVDLADCEHLHTAVLQALLAARVKVGAPPADAFLRAWVLPLLQAHRPAPEPIARTAGDAPAAAPAAGDEPVPAPTLEGVAP